MRTEGGPGGFFCMSIRIQGEKLNSMERSRSARREVNNQVEAGFLKGGGTWQSS